MSGHEIAERFAKETAGHEMTVLHDDGLYRHLRFRDPESPFYWFDLVTWPGNLAVNGDCGSFIFARTTDMFEFFRRGEINPGYWAEKIRCGSSLKSYSEDKFRQLVIEHFIDAARYGGIPKGLGKAVREDLLRVHETYDESGARQVLDGFAFCDFRFHDTWEWDLHDWDWTFLWCCHAIRWGIRQYDAASKQEAAA